MIFRLGDQTPPPAKRITDTVIERLEHQYEVDPELMTFAVMSTVTSMPVRTKTTPELALEGLRQMLAGAPE